MTTTEAALRECPFCGTSEHLSFSWPGSMLNDMPDRPCRVICSHIDHDTVVGPTAYGKYNAIAAWNRRSQPSPASSTAQEVDRLRLTLSRIAESDPEVDGKQACKIMRFLARSALSPSSGEPVSVAPAFSQIPPENISNGQPGNEKAQPASVAVEAEDPCPICGNEVRGHGGYLQCECPAPASPPSQELGRFGHHPEAAIDYECEIDALIGMAYDRLTGMQTHADLEDRIRKAMEFRVLSTPGELRWLSKHFNGTREIYAVMPECIEKIADRVGIVSAEPASPPPVGEAVAYTGSGSLMALKDGREGFIWPTPADAHPIPLYATPAEPASTVADDGERGWLIEHEDEPKWLTLRPGEAAYSVCWTKDSLEALRFCRRTDAEDYAASFMDEAPIRITEHRWG